MNTTEKYIEQKLREKVKLAGGIAYKFVSPGITGVPDRLVCMPGGRSAFVEVKAPGKELSPRQEIVRDELLHLGFPVFVLDEVKQIDEIIKAMRSAV